MGILFVFAAWSQHTNNNKKAEAEGLQTYKKMPKTIICIYIYLLNRFLWHVSIILMPNTTKEICRFEYCLWWDILDTTLYDNIYQWPVVGQWFSVSPTNTTERHDILVTETFLYVGLYFQDTEVYSSGHLTTDRHQYIGFSLGNLDYKIGTATRTTISNFWF
jgi:hypothetical protein